MIKAASENRGLSDGVSGDRFFAKKGGMRSRNRSGGEHATSHVATSQHARSGGRLGGVRMPEHLDQPDFGGPRRPHQRRTLSCRQTPRLSELLRPILCSVNGARPATSHRGSAAKLAWALAAPGAGCDPRPWPGGSMVVVQEEVVTNKD
eukprot:gene16977-biopygen4209